MAIKVRPRDASEADDEIGTKLRAIRIKQDMSQAELGEKLGVSFQQIQKYEKGLNRVPSSRLQQILKIFKVPVAYFYEPNKFADNEDSLFRNLDAATMRMLRCYSRIKSLEVRHQVVTLIETIAEQQDRD